MVMLLLRSIADSLPLLWLARSNDLEVAAWRAPPPLEVVLFRLAWLCLRASPPGNDAINMPPRLPVEWCLDRRGLLLNTLRQPVVEKVQGTTEAPLGCTMAVDRPVRLEPSTLPQEGGNCEGITREGETKAGEITCPAGSVALCCHAG